MADRPDVHPGAVVTAVLSAAGVVFLTLIVVLAIRGDLPSQRHPDPPPEIVPATCCPTVTYREDPTP